MNSQVRHPSLWLALLAATTLSGVAHAAPKPAKKQPVKKQAAKPKPKPKPGAVLGMVPMAGVEGKIGQTYTVDKDTPLNFTLNSAEYSLDRMSFGDNIEVADKSEKLLVLRYTVHNPTKSERQYYWGSLNFTAVDAKDQNREWVQRVGSKQTGEALSINLKPAQKVEAYTAIKVPARGVVPKLIVKPNSGGVIRYDLRGVVKPLAAPFADPSDASGVSAVEEISAQANTYYVLNNFDIKLLSTSYADALGEEFQPEEGGRLFVATISIRNGSPVNQQYYWGSFTAELTDADGEKVEWPQVLLKSSRNEKADGMLKPGEEYKARIYFSLPKDISAKTLKLSEGESHVVTFDVSKTQ